MKPTILLADDSPTIQRLVEQTFQEGRFNVVSVSNGDAAVRKFEEIGPAAVLADVFMPGRNGYEVCAFVRERSEGEETPVVLLVGAFEAFNEEEARRVGASGKISKPFEPQELLDMVSTLIGAEEEDAVPTPVAGAAATAEAPTPEAARAAPVATQTVTVAAETAATREEPEADADGDILGLGQLFPAIEPTTTRPALSEDELEAIADRVIERLSSEVIEGIAWEIVPDVAERVVREEIKKQG